MIPDLFAWTAAAPAQVILDDAAALQVTEQMDGASEATGKLRQLTQLLKRL